MATKLRDLAVVTGEYTNQQGETKKRYQNIGALMRSDDGNEFIMLAAWFNPAGVVRREGSESILVSCFKQRDQQQGGTQPAQQQRPAQQQNSGYQQPQNGGGAMDFNDDIPFAQHERGMII